jgi:hypothetical protein
MCEKFAVNAGDKIIALDENTELIVEGIWGKGTSKIIDFSAKYITHIGVDAATGDKVYANRGFSFEDEGTVWVKSR